jgi:hypothetical protein
MEVLGGTKNKYRIQENVDLSAQDPRFTIVEN